MYAYKKYELVGCIVSHEFGLLYQNNNNNNNSNISGRNYKDFISIVLFHVKHAQLR